MLEREIGHPNNGFVGRIAIGFNDDGTPLFACDLKLRAQVIDRNLLIAKVHRRAARDADDLVFYLRSQHEFRERDVDRYSWLQNEVGAEKQEKNHEKCDVEQRENQQQPELILFRPDQFHRYALYFAFNVSDGGTRRRASWTRSEPDGRLRSPLQKTRSYQIGMALPTAANHNLFFPAQIARAAFRARLKRNDSALRFRLGQHLHDFNPGAFHIVHQSIDPRRKIAVGDKRWRGDDQTGRGCEQTFVNP